MKCPLAVRWDLAPVNSGHVDGADRSFWTRAYEISNMPAGRLPRTIIEGRQPISLRRGILLGIVLCVSSKEHGVSAKMLLKWSRSLVIFREVRPNVLLGNPDTGAVVRRAHVSQLKPCPGQSCLG